MGYFNNPGTLDELDHQFNDLLNQYEYRSGKNISTIDDIRTEYKKIKAQMKKRLETVSKVEKSYNQSYTGRVVENYNTDLSGHGAESGGFMPGAGAAQPQQQAGQGQPAAQTSQGPQEQPADGSEQVNADGRSAGRSNYASETVRQSDYDWQKIFQTGEFAPKVQQSSTNPAGQNSAYAAQGSINTAAGQGSRQAAQGSQKQEISGNGSENRIRQERAVKNVRETARQDPRSLLSECKEDITDIIREVSRDRTSESYNMLEEIIFTYDDEEVTRWFNEHVDSMAARAKVYKYEDVRAQLERDFREAAQDQPTEAAYMLKIDKMIGAFIKKKFMEFEILYKDYEEEEAVQEEGRTVDRQLMRRGYILGILMGALIFAIGCFFGMIGIIIGFICGAAAAAVIGKTYYAWRVPDDKQESKAAGSEGAYMNRDQKAGQRH